MTVHLTGIPLVKAVMTAFPHSVERGASLETARALMVEHGIRHLPVLEDGRPVSVITDRDLQLAPEAWTVGDIARGEAYVVDLNEPLDVVLRHMAAAHLDCAVVVRDGKLAGIFTTTDACRHFAELLQKFFPRGGGGEAA
jgi:acetoin utilization protein AcuB